MSFAPNYYPPVQIPEAAQALPEDYSWGGTTKNQYPVLFRNRQIYIAVVKPDLVHWYGLDGNKETKYPTENFDQGFRLAHALLMLGVE